MLPIVINQIVILHAADYLMFLYQIFILIQLIMKKILGIIEEFLRKHPSPAQISLYQNLFKLNYIYSSPYTDSKHTKQVIYPFNNIKKQTKLQSQVKSIIYNQKGRIEESNSFDSILTKQKHEKLLQDDVFGKAKQNKLQTKWVYIAQIKQETTKSYFNQGKGKLPYKHDFGQTYDDIKQVAIFVWDKTSKNVFKVQIDKQLIPSCPSFSNDQGTQIIFHAYQKTNFGHGILHCFNRSVSIYEAKLQLEIKKEVEGQKAKKQEKKVKATVKKLIQDGHQTNIFPTISPCLNYLVYHSGTGITHTYYLDLVIAKKNGQDWIQTHRIKDHFVGFYNTLKNYMLVEEDRTFAISQTIQKSCSQIYKIDVETGKYQNLTQKFVNYDFDIHNVQPSGLISGTVYSNNFNTFFYVKGNDLKLIEPTYTQSFIQKQYNQPIPATLLYASEDHILQQYKIRANKRPLLVLPHGGPHGSFSNILTSYRYTLLKMGYAILFPNFSGSIGYGKDFLKAALKNIGQNDALQIISLLGKVLQDNPSIDKSNVHIQGGSYGGYLAAIMGSRYPQYFKSAVIMNGVLNISANLWFTDIPEWNTVQALSRHQLSELTQEHYLQMFKQSPVSQPMKIPTLQFLGAKDRRVPYRQGLLFDAITKDVGTPIATYVYENSAHSLADSVQTSIDIIVKTILFLQDIKQGEQSKEPQVKPKDNQ